MGDGNLFLVAFVIIFGSFLGVLFLARGRAYLKGRRPQPGSFEFMGVLRYINDIDALGGLPIQNLVYDHQWIMLGRFDVYLGLSLIILSVISLFKLVLWVIQVLSLIGH
jgi:hypothetical protein